MISYANQEQPRWPVAGGEMGALIRAHNWAETPLGAVENWPQALRSTVEMLTVHGFPIVALWGPDLVQIYNDGYRLLMADKHPKGLGQPTAACWPEVWHINEPIYERVWAGETLTFEDTLYPIKRHGPLEDAWFTLTYSPLRDDEGAVAGVLVTVFETTERHLSDQRRNKSEALLRIALTGSGMGAWRWDLQKDLIWGDSQFLALWGFPPSNGPHPLTLFTDRMSPDGAAEMEGIVTKSIEAGEEFDGQLEIVSGPTAGRWVRWRGRADLHTPSILHGTSFDITEQRRADEALRHSEERFRAFVTASSDVVYRMNPDWSEMRQLVGQSFLADTNEPSTGWLDRYIHPDDHATVQAAINRAISTKSMFELEHRVLRANGSLGWTHSRAVPIISGDGSISEWLGSASDVTIVHEADDQLRKSEERQTFLLKLSDVLRPLANPIAIQLEAMRVLGEHLGVTRAQYYEADASGEYLDSAGGYTHGAPPVVGRVRIDDFGPYVTKTFHAGRTLAVANVALDPRVSRAELESYDTLGVRAFVGVPLVKSGRLKGTLGLHQSVPRHWTEQEISLAEETAERTWAAVERAHTEAALHASQEQQTFLVHLSDALRDLKNMSDLQTTATHLLGEYLNVNRAGFGDLVVQGGQEIFQVTQDFHTPDVPSMVGTYPVARFGPTLLACMRGRATLVVADVETDERFTAAQRETYRAAQIRAYVTLSVLREGRCVATFGVHQRETRHWTPAEVKLVEETAERTWVAIERARAESALRDSEERFRLFVQNVHEYALVRTDAAGLITNWNPGAERLFGYATEEVLHQPFQKLLTEEDARSGVLDRELATVLQTGRHEDLREVVRKNRSRFWAYWVTEAICHDDGVFLGTAKVMHDETERRAADAVKQQAAEATEHALHEKEALLKEVHHRVKNNLQVITSLLNLQASQLTDERVLSVFAETRHRVQSIAFIHELLYRSTSFAAIDLADYARQLLPNLIQFYGLSPRVQGEVVGQGVTLELSRAVPYGLLLNELISNALKHAFPGDRMGRLQIQVQQPGQEIVVTVADDGIGLPAEFTPERATSLGLRIVRLLSRQLGAQVHFLPGPGTRCELRLPQMFSPMEE